MLNLRLPQFFSQTDILTGVIFRSLLFGGFSRAYATISKLRQGVRWPELYLETKPHFQGSAERLPTANRTCWIRKKLMSMNQREIYLNPGPQTSKTYSLTEL